MNDFQQNINNIRKKLEKDLKESRYLHTLGVAYTAASLAMRYGVDMQKALLAGYLHDCAKCLSEKEMRSLIKEGGLYTTVYEDKNPKLLHAKAGAVLAEKGYGIKDREIQHAIMVHTTGAPGMSMLDEIIFTADYIEPGRDKAPGLPALREEAFSSLHSCTLHILEDTVNYLRSSGSTIDPATSETYSYYKKLYG